MKDRKLMRTCEIGALFWEVSRMLISVKEMEGDLFESYSDPQKRKMLFFHWKILGQVSKVIT